MCFVIQQGLSRALVCNEDHRVEKECDSRGGGQTHNEAASYNVAAEMTLLISFLPTLAIRARSIFSPPVGLGEAISCYLFSFYRLAF